jgi:tRNA 2-thiocytidine biosynthesis protein TtcA
VVIRPLVHVRERDLARYAELNEFPIIPCTLCGSQEHLQREAGGADASQWEKKYPGRIDSIFGALGNVVPSHLMDRALFDFAAVTPSGVPTADGTLLRRRPGARARRRRSRCESRDRRRHRHPARSDA